MSEQPLTIATAARDFRTYELSIISFLKSTPMSVKSDGYVDVLALPTAMPTCLAVIVARVSRS